ncbi:MAG: hypothetical protein MN733_16315, partial [Nitrososphaera sp.]|nr:hypothetical protein [Nitrososphaera sp.]
KEVQGLKTGLNIGTIGPGLGALEAGNTACDSGCDSGCGGGGLVAAADVKAIGLGRLNAVFEARKLAGIERIAVPGGGLEAGNDACDSGCDGGCAGRGIGATNVLAQKGA